MFFSYLTVSQFSMKKFLYKLLYIEYFTKAIKCLPRICPSVSINFTRKQRFTFNQQKTLKKVDGYYKIIKTELSKFN